MELFTQTPVEVIYMGKINVYRVDSWILLWYGVHISVVICAAGGIISSEQEMGTGIHMLKNLGYDGAYRDEDVSVSVLLENPSDYGFEAATLVFSVTVRAGSNGTIIPKLDDFTFYVMDETNRLYNAQVTLYSKSAAEDDSDNDEPARQPDGLVRTGFQYDFLFQDLRIAFYCRSCDKINIIRLKH